MIMGTCSWLTSSRTEDVDEEKGGPVSNVEDKSWMGGWSDIDPNYPRTAAASAEEDLSLRWPSLLKFIRRVTFIGRSSTSRPPSLPAPSLQYPSIHCLRRMRRSTKRSRGSRRLSSSNLTGQRARVDGQ